MAGIINIKRYRGLYISIKAQKNNNAQNKTRMLINLTEKQLDGIKKKVMISNKQYISGVNKVAFDLRLKK